jgi:diguanylate cyclase (GGDEF)-like protein
MGIGSFVLGGLLLLGYLAVTPHGPHRGIMLAIDIGSMFASIAIIGPIGARSLSRPWREAFFFSWSVWTLMVIVAAVGLDGGVGSPLAGLLVLPVLFGGLLYDVLEEIGLAVLALGSFGLIYVTGQSVSGARALATTVMIGMAGGISVTAAMNRHIDEQERQVLTGRLHHLATYDGLTGCLNYQALQEALANESDRAQRYDRPLGAVIADVDWFKVINDRHGHSVGDATLTSVASVLLNGVRSMDVVGRLGGDEFAILLPEGSEEEARSLVERLQAEVARVVTLEDVTLSFGVSTWNGPEDTPAELLRRADAALYEAKEQGRNRMAVWASSATPSLPVKG